MSKLAQLFAEARARRESPEKLVVSIQVEEEPKAEPKKESKEPAANPSPLRVAVPRTTQTPAARLNFADIMARAKAVQIESQPEPEESESRSARSEPARESEPSRILVDGEPLEESEEPEVASTYMAQGRLKIADDSIQLDESQEEAVKGLVASQFGCLIGAAGTGKTTTTRKVLDVLINGAPEWGIEPIRLSRVDLTGYHGGDKSTEDKKEKAEDEKADVIPGIVLCAFTGQATQVIKKHMPGEWHKNVMTIHSMLGYAPEEWTDESGKERMRFAPTYGKLNKMPWDIIVIDEASMVATELYQEILDACKPSTRIYMIGDLNQLTPPIGEGILGFALTKWPIFELTHVHRQKDEAANKIVDAAWNILQGEWPEFDDASKDYNWRVIGMEIDHQPEKAHRQIIAIAKHLSNQRVSAKVDESQPPIYDPWRDRILTNGNGYDENRSSSLLGQYPLNESLSSTFAAEDKPRIVIDAGINKKRFAEGYRVMATKNEPPNMINRVTNGLTGIIEKIEPNKDWVGDLRLVGPEQVVRENQKAMLLTALGGSAGAGEESGASAFADFSFEGLKISDDPAAEGRNSGPASHKITIRFDNGGTRIYGTKAQVDQLMIAYSSTVHKAQGAEMPTVIIVLHHALSRMLNRESLYTAVTRASERVIILYTDKGMRTALARQEIFGDTLEAKVKQYEKMTGTGGMKLVKVNLEPEGSEGAQGYE